MAATIAISVEHKLPLSAWMGSHRRSSIRRDGRFAENCLTGVTVASAMTDNGHFGRRVTSHSRLYRVRSRHHHHRGHRIGAIAVSLEESARAILGGVHGAPA